MAVRPNVPTVHSREEDHRRELSEAINLLADSDPYYSKTGGEKTQNLTIADFFKEPGDVRRYEKNTTPGTTDMRAAFVAADSLGGEVLVTGGDDYVIATSLTLTSSIRITPGSRVSVSSGATLTLDGPVVGGPWEMFTGDGDVVFG